MAIIFGMARILLPYASDYKADITSTLSEYLGQPVKVGSLDTEWHGFGPALVLKEIDILDSKSKQPVLQFGKARIGIGLISSLFQQKPVLSGITLVGVDLVLTREKNGRFVVAGIETENNKDGGDAGDLDALTAWVFSQGELGLEQSNITWRDKMGAGRKLHFSAINVRLKNSGDHHVLDASVALPKKFGKSLTLHVDMEGDLLNANERETRAYFRGEEVMLASLLETQSIGGVGADVGKADFQIWSQWKNGELQKIQGEVDVSDVELFSSSLEEEKKRNAKTDEAALELQYLAGKFKWLKKESGWQFNANDLVLLSNGFQWEPTQVVINVKNNSEGIELFDAYASHLQLEDAAQLLVLFSVGGEAVSTPLLAVKPKGKVKNARFIWKNNETPTFNAYARLGKAEIDGWQFVPAVKNLNGQLWLNENGGQVDLKNSAMTLNFPDLFRWPLQVDELNGHIGWTIDDNGGWHLVGRDLAAKNKDVYSRIAVDIVKENADISPFLSIVAKFTNGDGSQVTHYLPTGIMSDQAVDWLDKSIIEGHIPSGGTIVHGRMSDFPFDKGNGRFETRFGVEGGRLDYAEGWPSVHDIDAEVQFLGKGLFVNARHGKIFSNDIQWATVTLPDMKSKPMHTLIKGNIKGITQDKLNFLVESPQLNESFGKNLEGMTAKGESLLHLDLDLPIGGDKKTLLQGWVDLAENSLSIPGLGRVLSEVDGRVHFYQDGLKADDLQAELFSQATSLKIFTDEDMASISTKFDPENVKTEIAKNHWINIQADGLLNASDVASFYFPPIKDLLKGGGDWDVLFRIPVGGSEEKSNIATLRAKTNLKGVEVNLPPPFNKRSDDSAEVKLQVDFRPEKPPFLRASYGGFIDGLFELGAQSGESNATGIQRGEVRLGGGDVSLPDGKGVRIIGWLDEVSFGDWLHLLTVDDVGPTAQKTNPSFLHSMDIAIRNLDAYGQNLHKVKLKTVPADNAWAFDISSNELSGTFEIPSNVTTHPVKANLKHLYLVEPELTAGSIDPRDIPSLDFQVKDLRYESRRFGELKLETTRVANGLRIEQLILKPKETTIISHGGWYTGSGKENSTIQAQINTTNAGRTLKELGYVGTISGGWGNVHLNLQWPSAFFDVDVNQVHGTMNMFLRDGQMLDIDPGAGRLFGMLSLQTLPRRLFLDFSDVFDKGFGFSRIKGEFRIEGGDAYTSNLYLDGPAARIDISGRAGLAEQDYDQQVIVTPKVAESLPVLGALTATPQIGAVILFVKKLFQSDIDEATKTQYTITGKWSSPIITKLKPPKPAVRPEAEQIEDD
jgi:uncharacterized protein (TIGR02099 family)